MKKYASLIAGAALLMSVIPALAVKPPEGTGGNGPAVKSNVGQLYLYEKEPVNWTIVEGGAWGKMTYNLSGPTFDYVFNGHGLTPNTDYSLIYYADPWPGNHPGALLGSGTSDNGGNVHLAGSPTPGSLPNSTDANFPTGAKVWLVLSSDYDSGLSKMTAWNPTEYLFEHNLINYTQTP